LADETCLVNKREKALAFVRALPGELEKQVTPMLYAGKQGPGQYTLAEAFEIAEKVDLATPSPYGMQRVCRAGSRGARQQ
jgi:hypothetical protein